MQIVQAFLLFWTHLAILLVSYLQRSWKALGPQSLLPSSHKTIDDLRVYDDFGFLLLSTPEKGSSSNDEEDVGHDVDTYD